MNTLEFIEYVKDQYPSVSLRKENYLECAYFLEGLLIQYPDNDNIKRCINVLRNGNLLIDILERDAYK